MWSQSFSKTVQGVTSVQVWDVWTDINQWTAWQGDLDAAKLEGEFKVGNTFLLQPKGGPRVNIELLVVEPGRKFTDLTRFPLAQMEGCHEFVETPKGLEIRTTMSVRGPLAFVWRKLVAEGIVKGLEEQTDALVARARSLANAAA
jgi:hypothetical protein